MLSRIKNSFFYRTWEERFWYIKNRFSWVEGRQTGSFYQKIVLLWNERFKFDVHLLRIPKGPGVSSHRDKCDENFIHRRLNIFLLLPNKGGAVYISGPHHRWCWNRIHLFSASKYTHWVTPIKEGKMMILSIGWLSKYK